MHHYISKYLTVKYYRTTLEWLFFGLFAGVGLYLLPNTPVAFELQKAQLFLNVFRWLVFFSLPLVFLDRQVQNRVKQLGKNRIIQLLMLLVCIIGISSWLGSDEVKSVFGNFWRNDGLLTMSQLWLLSVVTAVLWRPTLREKIVSGIAVGVFGNVLFLAVQLALRYGMGWSDLSDWGLSFGATFNQPVFLAGYLAVSAPIIADRLKQIHPRAADIFVAVTVAALCFTATWGALLSLLLAFVLMRQTKGASQKTFMALLAATVLVVVLLVNAPSISSIRTRADNRTRYWVNLVFAGAQRPLLGWGWANVDHAFASTEWPFHREVDINLDKAHSQLLEYLVTTGTLGLAAYVLLLSVSLKQLRRAAKRERWYSVAVTTLVIYIVFSQTNVLSIATEMLFWTCIGIAAANELDRTSN